LGGVEFQIDSVNNKGQYSIDGGLTWANFSSGGILEEVVASAGRFFASERAGDYADIAGRRFNKPNNNKTYFGYSRIGSSYGWWTAGKTQADVTNDNTWGGVLDYIMPSGNHIFVNGIVNGAYGNPAAYPTTIVLNGVTVATFASTGGWSMYYTNTYWNDESFSTLMILEALLYS